MSFTTDNVECLVDRVIELIEWIDGLINLLVGLVGRLID